MRFTGRFCWGRSEEKVMKMNRIQSLLVALGVAAFTFALCYFDPFYAVDKILADPLFQHSGSTDPSIKIIKIDEKSMDKLGTYNTWNRDYPAQLIEKLSENPDAKPAVIAMDILYISDMDEEGDARLAKACEAAGNVVVGANLVYDKTAEKDENGDYYVDEMHIRMIEKPYDALNAVTECGFANTTQDKDGYIRQALAYADTDEGYLYSFSYMVYQNYMKYLRQAAVTPKLYSNHRFDFTFSGKSGDYETVSMCDVLDGTVDPRAFAGSIVMVGAYAPGMQDAYNVSVQRGTQMYGVEIHANIVEALMEGKTQVPADRLLTALLMSLFTGLFFLAIYRLSPQVQILCVIAASAVEIGLGYWLYSQGYIISLINVPLVLLAIFVGQVARNYLMESRKRRQVVNAFKKYMAPQVVDRLSKDGEFKLTLGGESRDVAVLFVDIRGFTTMSESLEPEKVVEILNDYLNLTTNAIFKNGGMLDKFIGDATMAVFNAPYDLDDYVYKAVCAARDIAAGADELEKTMMERFGKPVSFGIGVSCGPAVVGNIGCDFRMDYTAIGDTVNTASRLEGQAKRGQILISQAVYEKVKDRVEAAEIGVIPLKGKSNGIFVYSVEKVL